MLAKNQTSYCDPSLADDVLGGYAIGSRWINLQTGIEWICFDDTQGAAKWRPLVMGYGWASGSYRAPDYITQIGDSQPTANKAVYLPIIISEVTPIDKIGVVLVTAQAGAKCRIAIYHGDGGLPTRLRSDFGELDLSNQGGATLPATVLLSTGAVLQPGLYFLAVVFFASGTMPTVKRVSGAQFGVVKGGSAADLTGGNPGRYYIANMTYGSWPSAAHEVSMSSGTDGAVVVLRRQ